MSPRRFPTGDHSHLPTFARTLRVARLALAALAVVSLHSASALATPSLESYALSVGGNSHGETAGCASFIAPAAISAFFGGGLGLPLDGLSACNVAGDFIDSVAPTGPIFGDRTLETSWIEGTLTGAAHSRANFGSLSARGTVTYVGSHSSTTVAGSEGFGRCRDQLTITSPSVASGQPGTVRFLVSVVGGLSTSAGGTADVELNYQFAGGSIFTMFRSQVNDAVTIPYINSLFGVGIAGFTAIPGSMSGTGQPTTFAHSIVFGTPFDFELGLFAYAIPGGAPGATVASQFQAQVSGVVVTGPQGQVLPDIVVAAASGTPYGPGGIAGVEDSPSARSGDTVRLTATPNPSRSGTRLSFSLPATLSARLEIFDTSGRRVRSLESGSSAGAARREVWWDGRNDLGSALPDGAYFARLRWSDGSRTLRVALIR